MLRPLNVFLSSTFRDLQLERRFVADLLRERGFHVVTMERDCPPDFDWYRWSTNRAGQCEVFICLLADRLGTPGPWKDSAVWAEDTHARGAAIMLYYKLQRPFEDVKQMCHSDDDIAKYEASLNEKDDDRWDHIQVWIEKATRKLREPIQISSASQLRKYLQADIQISRWQLMRHRLGRWRSGYFNTNEAAWQRASEDESSHERSSRVAVLRRLRSVMILGALSLLGGLLAGWLPFWQEVWILIGAALAATLIVFASAPSYLWIGTQTVVARGLFGLCTLQQSRAEPFTIRAWWSWLDHWCDVGAISVHFASGRWVFVPFVRTSWKLARVGPMPPRPRRMPEPPPEPISAKEFEANLRHLVEEIKRNEEERATGKNDQQASA